MIIPLFCSTDSSPESIAYKILFILCYYVDVINALL